MERTVACLRVTNKELARKLESASQLLKLSRARIVDLQTENTKLHVQLGREKCDNRKLMLELSQVRDGQNEFLCLLETSIREYRGLPSCSAKDHTLASHVSQQRCTLNDTTNTPDQRQAATKGKAEEVRVAREELNVPTLTQTPIARKPAIADIPEDGRISTSKRRRTVVSYVEPHLNKKLRAGDPHTENNPFWDPNPRMKSAKSGKSKTASSRKRRHSAGPF